MSEDLFHLYAVCSRFPQGLADAVPLQRLQEGVYECRRGTDVFRIVVANELPSTENNALLHLLSALPDQVRYGESHYRQRSEETSTLLNELFEGYQREGLTMPYTMQDWRRDFILEHFHQLTPEERCKALRELPAEERLEGLSPKEIEAYLKRHKHDRSSPKRKRKP